MKTTVIKIKRPDDKTLKAVNGVLAKGGIVAFPTDTVYGLAASAFNRDAVKKIYSLKGRSYKKPLILMAGDLERLKILVQFSAKAQLLSNNFWPGPLTLILPTTELGQMVSGGRKDIGVRIPADKTALAILKNCRFPLFTTSANPSRKPSAKNGREAAGYFKGKVDLIVDSGACRHGAESTVIDATHYNCLLVREGCLPSKKLLKYI
ncbi:MAG: threonylcarbamoyl-AMP synthase [Endomicrobiales bacterium]|nr:threonylcarbamoyl-AMP synthase [Endomicrobiales bacterium]